jgi:hypothetical protein
MRYSTFAYALLEHQEPTKGRHYRGVAIPARRGPYQERRDVHAGQERRYTGNGFDGGGHLQRPLGHRGAVDIGHLLRKADPYGEADYAE